MSKTRIEHKETIDDGFFILQYANLTLSQLKYNSFSSFCDPNKYEFIEMDTNILNMELSVDKVDEIFRPETQSLWYWMRQSDLIALTISQQTLAAIFSHENVAISMPLLIREHLIFLWRNFVVPRWTKFRDFVVPRLQYVFLSLLKNVLLLRWANRRC